MFYKICACPSCTCVNITNFPSFFHCHWKCWNTCDSSFIKHLQDFTAPIEKVPRRQEKRLLSWTFQTLKPPSGARNAPDFLFCLFNRGRYSTETSATLFFFSFSFFPGVLPDTKPRLLLPSWRYYSLSEKSFSCKSQSFSFLLRMPVLAMAEACNRAAQILY